MTTEPSASGSGIWPNAMYCLTGSIQNYQWGSTTLLAGLRGEEPTEEPEAEIWYGAHPDSPTALSDSVTLFDHISSDPASVLGQETATSYDGQLPFLLKLLAADSPLSIQAHPSAEQARAGFEREDAAGIARDAADRSFRDQSHKPELIVAVTPFEALVGFRSSDATVSMLRAFGVDDLAQRCETNAPLDVVRWLFASKNDDADRVANMVAQLDVGAASYEGDKFAGEADLLTRVCRTYPGDPGVAVAALLNRRMLAPGNGLYLAAGTLHAYIGGLGVEIMANSNNVLRGGLTPKHIDPDTLLDVLHSGSGPIDVIEPDEAGRYLTPTPEFALSVITNQASATGPGIVLCTSGTTSVHLPGSSGPAPLELSPTNAVWLDADETVEVRTSGTAYLAQVGSSAKR